jgi:hypothetical protein
VVIALAIACLPAAARADELRSTSDVFLWTAAGFQLGHQIDHFGRSDFSAPAIGLPLVFFASTLGGRYVLDGGPLYFTVVDAFWIVGFSITHFSGVVETPDTVYAKWTDPDGPTVVHSHVAGRVAQGVIVGAVISLGAHLSLTLVDGRRHGFTWRRRSTREDTRLTIAPVAGGAAVAWSGTW